MARLVSQIALISLVVLSGCSLTHIESALTDQPVELVTTPFFSQQEQQCGPAALATVLQASGVTVTPDALVSQVFLPKRGGSLQAELKATVRRYNRLPYAVQPNLQAVSKALQQERPVLILQDLGAAFYNQYHYAVVVGVTPTSFILRSGATRRLEMKYGSFLRTWKRGGFWGIVVLKPGEFPPDMEEVSYLQEVAGLEAVGKSKLATAYYTAFLTRFPDSEAARFGLANARYALSEYGQAVRLYRQLLDEHPDNPLVVNNLAEALSASGCTALGISELEAYLERNTDTLGESTRSLLLATHQELVTRRHNQSVQEKSRDTARCQPSSLP